MQKDKEQIIQLEKELTFEVGGTIFCEKKSLLCKYSGSKLANLFGAKLSTLPLNENDQPTLDRNAKAFKLMLNYLKSDEKFKPSNEHLRGLLERELAYFGLSEGLLNPSKDKVSLNETEESLRPLAMPHEWLNTDGSKQLEPITVEKINEMFAQVPSRCAASVQEKWKSIGPLSVHQIIEKINEYNLPEVKLPLRGFFFNQNELCGQYLIEQGHCGFCRS